MPYSICSTKGPSPQLPESCHQMILKPLSRSQACNRPAAAPSSFAELRNTRVIRSSPYGTYPDLAAEPECSEVALTVTPGCGLESEMALVWQDVAAPRAL